MAVMNVNPTRMELTNLKRKLSTARRGHKLLKDKRDELMRRFLDLVKENKALRIRVEEGIKQANVNMEIARSAMNDKSLSVAMMLPTQEMSLESSEKNVMSVMIPVFDVQYKTADRNDIYSYGTAFTSAELDNAVSALSEIMPDMLRLAEIEKSCQLLAGEIEKTRRRVNALEHVMIPQYEETIKYISMKLDENGNLVDLAAGYSAPEEYLVGMSMFIMERKKLISVIRDMVPHGKYHFERDFILQHYLEGRLKGNVYPFHNVALFNESVLEYYNNSMALLKEDVRRSLFRSEVPIYTKVRDAVPTLFGENGQAPNCVLADGCHLYGCADSCVIFREVDIEEGADVRDSIIMQGSHIGAHAKLRYVILDKNVTIKPGTQLLGSPDHPLVINKGAVI